jgi:hypothetical protein
VSNTTFEQIGKVLREHQHFAILGHVRPDGDALGSQLALALSLQQLGKDVRVWNEDGMLEKYSFLPRAELLTKPQPTSMLPSRLIRQFKIGSELRSLRLVQQKSGSTSIITLAIPATAIW